MGDGTRNGLSVAFVAVVIAYAALSGIWSSSQPGWYASLRKPSWQPPDVVFGVMWPLNFAAIAVAGVAIARIATTRHASVILAVLVVSVGCALAWAYLFYTPPHRFLAAAIALCVAAAVTWTIVVLALRVRAWTGFVLMPYALWLSIATSLAFGYWRLARTS